MKMKLAICTRDEVYAARMIDYFSIHFSDRMELSQYTEIAYLADALKNERSDICLIGDELLEEIEGTEVEKKNIAVLTEEKDAVYENKKSIFKYQKAELIYKELLNLYADFKSNAAVFREHNEKEAYSYAFLSPMGGTGATTVALAYATYLAKTRNVLYVSLQQYSNAEVVLHGEGNGKFDDVIFALKSKRGALAMKLESLVRHNKDNVSFFETCDNPLDLQELTEEEVQRLLREFIQSGLYQDVIIDIDSQLHGLEKTVLKEVEHIIVVANGDRSNEEKLNKFHTAMESLEEQEGVSLLYKTKLFYNKYSNKTSEDASGNLFKVIGGIAKFEGVQMEGIVTRMALMDGLGEILKLESGANE